MKRHHNNKGLRQIRRGKTRYQVKAMAKRMKREGLYAGRQMTHRIDGRIITLIEPYENNGWVVDVERVGIMGRRREGREEILIHYIEQFYT